jgi:hypothetical protein
MILYHMIYMIRTVVKNVFYDLPYDENENV